MQGTATSEPGTEAEVEEMRTEFSRKIVGTSVALERVLAEADVVAPTCSTVLIQGETGTGKELIARAIYERSARCDRAFVTLNCAAIPGAVLESELFGHERGAFTGALERKLGRFEVADGGTLFLDEVGDIPLELQPKLLRVLQEQEFERLGGTRTIRVDVRLVAATNRDLLRMVEEQCFRDDLYYRLNVFPIQIPPLRERPEDIPRCPSLRSPFRRADGPSNRGHPARDDARAAAAPLAGQRSAAREPGRALGDPLDGADTRGPARGSRAAHDRAPTGRWRGDHPGGLRALAHPRRARGGELDGRGPAGCGGASRDETHDAAVDDEAPRHREAVVAGLRVRAHRMIPHSRPRHRARRLV
jgi:hypothetical protein